VSLTRAARVTVQFFSPRGVKIYTWHFSVKAGRTIEKLNIPRQVRRPGVYSMRWTAKAGGDLASKRLKIRMIGLRVVKFAEPIEVVLSGQAPKGAGAKLPKGKPRVVKATGIETTFDAAADRKTDARVIVVDVDEFGVAFVRDLHTVFPSVKIVALSSSPRTMARALKAGAVIALPRSTPPATLAKVIQKLLTPPKKPVKAKAAHRSQGPPAKS